MATSRRTNALLLTLMLVCAGAAQTAASPQAKSQPTARQPVEAAARSAKVRADAARSRKERQAAVAILLEVERDAASLEDGDDRARVRASCADALWDVDEGQARAMFRRVWEAAVESDEADLKEAKEGGYSDDPGWFTGARETVLKFAARRDARMAEDWVRSLEGWFGRNDNTARADAGAASGEARLDGGMYYDFTRDGRLLALASSLAGEGEYATAARVAAPVARGGVTGPLIEFLLNLRARVPEEADRLYLNLLASARANPSADANDVLLLSAYALTPRLLAIVDDDGSLRFRAHGAAGNMRAREGGDAARAAFYNAAASILVRPGTAEAAAAPLYFALGRLLPFFERDAPAHAPALRARMSAVAASLEATRRASLDSTMATHSLAPQNPSDPLAPLLENIEQLDAAGMGDGARARAVSIATKGGLWARAKQLAGEIKDDKRRAAALSLIGVRQVEWLPKTYAEAEGEDFEQAAAFARQVELPYALAPALRAYALAQAAEFAARSGRGDIAPALLDEAIAQAQQAETGTGLRAAAALAVATCAARRTPSRTWETLAAAVSSINADEEFSGNSAEFKAVKYGPDESEALTKMFAPFTVESLFGEAGVSDLRRATAEARNLQAGLVRSYALVAAARATLRKGSRGGR